MAKSPLLSPLDSISIDHTVVIIANLINLALIALFLSRPLLCRNPQDCATGLLPGYCFCASGR